MKHRIYVVGMGPGQENMMTQEAMQVLEASDVIIGYTVYLKLLGERFGCKELLSTPMRQERERCQMCFEKAREGKKVALICSGDAGIYGMASLMLEIGKLYDDCIIEVIPGITAASSGAAVLGAPLNHDFCVISLSDLLTPWERIKKRPLAAQNNTPQSCRRRISSNTAQGSSVCPSGSRVPSRSSAARRTRGKLCNIMAPFIIGTLKNRAQVYNTLLFYRTGKVCARWRDVV